jgi:hypothetical protein
MRRENDGVAGFQCEHRIAHRRDDWVRDGANGADHSHRLRNKNEILLIVLPDDPARLLSLEVIPDDPGLALRFENLVVTPPVACSPEPSNHLPVAIRSCCALPAPAVLR